MKDILPKRIKSQKDKKRFITPEERWVKEDSPALVRAKIQGTIKNSEGIINPVALEYFDEIVAGKIPFNYTYWRMIQWRMDEDFQHQKLKFCDAVLQMYWSLTKRAGDF